MNKYKNDDCKLSAVCNLQVGSNLITSAFFTVNSPSFSRIVYTYRTFGNYFNYNNYCHHPI